MILLCIEITSDNLRVEFFFLTLLSNKSGSHLQWVFVLSSDG